VSTDGLASALSSDAAAAAPPASALVRCNASHRSKYTHFVEARGVTCCKDHYVSLSMGGFYINVLIDTCIPNVVPSAVESKRP
jgi:hypothetical protein